MTAESNSRIVRAIAFSKSDYTVRIVRVFTGPLAHLPNRSKPPLRKNFFGCLDGRVPKTADRPVFLQHRNPHPAVIYLESARTLMRELLEKEKICESNVSPCRRDGIHHTVLFIYRCTPKDYLSKRSDCVPDFYMPSLSVPFSKPSEPCLPAQAIGPETPNMSGCL